MARKPAWNSNSACPGRFPSTGSSTQAVHGTLADPVAAVSIATDLNPSIVAAWHELEQAGASTPYQSIAWYETWTRIIGGPRSETPFIITARDENGRVTLLLPLVLRSRGSIRIASFAGGKHSNFNAPLFRTDVVFTEDAVERFFAAVARLWPAVDLLAIDALPATWNGLANPLVGRRSRAHTAAASLLDLDPDPERLFATYLSADRRRKARASARRLAKVGVAMHHVTSRLDIDRALRAFVDHKAAWFASRGLTNPFETPGMTAFFTELASQPASGVEIYSLHGDDGIVIAVAGTITRQHRVSLMFVSHDAASPLAAHSPGTKLIREIIADACRGGLKMFDFGLGEASYKVSLGARSELSYVTFLPLTVRGRLAAVLLDARRRAKVALKRHPRLLAALLRVRRSLLPALNLQNPLMRRPSAQARRETN
jgi:CelD/BcsL family acetyltransferase involved in cellulose biosynthesis